MTVLQGYVTEVQIGTDIIAEQNTIRYNVNAPPETYFVFGDLNEQTLPGGVIGSGTVSGYFDATDTAQQALIAAVEAGTLVDLGVYPSGNTSGLPEWRGNVSVTDIEVNSVNPGIQGFSMNFRGVLLRGTVA